MHLHVSSKDRKYFLLYDLSSKRIASIDPITMSSIFILTYNFIILFLQRKHQRLATRPWEWNMVISRTLTSRHLRLLTSSLLALKMRDCGRTCMGVPGVRNQPSLPGSASGFRCGHKHSFILFTHFYPGLALLFVVLVRFLGGRFSRYIFRRSCKDFFCQTVTIPNRIPDRPPS